MKGSHAYLRLTTGFLTIFCIALAVQAVACLVLFAHMVGLLLDNGISADGGRFLLLLMVNTLCDAVTFFSVYDSDGEGQARRSALRKMANGDACRNGNLNVSKGGCQHHVADFSAAV